ncbi:MAG TPA: hypothetical protein VJB89_02375 [Candidatus Nanoarchaeia archaeon]|nr:hypothetical protein [Candidatus Nanoarchaeia archaeon]
MLTRRAFLKLLSRTCLIGQQIGCDDNHLIPESDLNDSSKDIGIFDNYIDDRHQVLTNDRRIVIHSVDDSAVPDSAVPDSAVPKDLEKTLLEDNHLIPESDLKGEQNRDSSDDSIYNNDLYGSHRIEEDIITESLKKIILFIPSEGLFNEEVLRGEILEIGDNACRYSFLQMLFWQKCLGWKYSGVILDEMSSTELLIPDEYVYFKDIARNGATTMHSINPESDYSGKEMTIIQRLAPFKTRIFDPQTGEIKEIIQFNDSINPIKSFISSEGKYLFLGIQDSADTTHARIFSTLDGSQINSFESGEVGQDVNNIFFNYFSTIFYLQNEQPFLIAAKRWADSFDSRICDDLGLWRSTDLSLERILVDGSRLNNVGIPLFNYNIFQNQFSIPTEQDIIGRLEDIESIGFSENPLKIAMRLSGKLGGIQEPGGGVSSTIVYDVETDSIIPVCKFFGEEAPYELIGNRISPNGRFFVYGPFQESNLCNVYDENNRYKERVHVIFYDFENGQPFSYVTDSDQDAFCLIGPNMAFSPDGNYVLLNKMKFLGLRREGEIITPYPYLENKLVLYNLIKRREEETLWQGTSQGPLLFGYKNL